MDCSKSVNPWALFQGEDNTSKNICDNTIDNRFPNHFRRSSSLVTCHFCNVILLKNQTQQHFKIHHNQKFKKKFSKFKIPFNAVEGYELICEIRRKKLATSNINSNNKSSDLFKIKVKHSENNLIKQSTKTPPKIMKMSLKESKSTEYMEPTSPKIDDTIEKPVIKITEIVPLIDEDDKKLIRKTYLERKNVAKSDSRKMSKRSNSMMEKRDNKKLKSADLKINIRLNSDGLLTSCIKGESENCSNIFDRMSHFCDHTGNIKPYTDSAISSRGVIKQSGFDKSYGCAIFTDQFNNSILIDNDKDETDDFDCCESSLSNDSAYFSLPNTTANSIATTVCKTSNLSSSSIAPPLVTAYQYSSSTNKVSHCTNNSQIKTQLKTTPLTKNLSYNSIVPAKSTVKHRFYVSGHSNQTIVNTLKKKTNENTDIDFLLENDESIIDFQANGVLHSLSKESQDLCYFDNNNLPVYQNLKHTIKTKSCMGSFKDMTNSRFDSCFEENGLRVCLLIPKRLKWTQSKSRRKSVAQLNIVNSKQSPKNIDDKLSLNRNLVKTPVSENPLLTSYTIETSSLDCGLQSDPMLTSEIVLDYQISDRNQMSFQQRLLERGVISQKDIVRSQRCLSLNINSTSRKNNKATAIKPNITEYKRISSNKPYSIKTQLLSQNAGYHPSNSNSSTMGQIKSAILQQTKVPSTLIMSHDNKINTIPKQSISHRKQAWREDNNLSRIQNVSTFHGQCLSQNCKYINSDSKVTVSPCQNRNTTIPSHTRTLENRNVGIVFRPTSPNSSFLHPHESYNSILAAQNSLPNDSNCYPQQQMERRCINISKNDFNHHFKTSNNEFVNYQQSYDDYNPSSIALHSNYQTVYSSQNKFANHSTNIYNANFEL